MVSLTRSKFTFDFSFVFFMFLLPTCCDVCLFVGFCMGDSDGRAVSFVIHDNGFLFYCTWFKVAHS